MKVIPSFTSLPRDEEGFRRYLSSLQQETVPVGGLGSGLRVVPSPDGRQRQRMLQLGFHDRLGQLSEPSIRFLSEEISFPELLLQALSGQLAQSLDEAPNFEIPAFYRDLVKFLHEGPLTSRQILERLSKDPEYRPHVRRGKRRSHERHLWELLKFGALAGILSRGEDGQSFGPGPSAPDFEARSLENDPIRELADFLMRHAHDLPDVQQATLLRAYQRALSGKRRSKTKADLDDALAYIRGKGEERVKEARKERTRQRRREKNRPKHDPRPPTTFEPRVQPLPLYKWQSEALQEWVDAGRRGVIEAVTGTGKTRLALLITTELLRSEPAARVSIVVPTQALLYQWKEELIRDFNVRAEDVGLQGHGHKDVFSDERRILIWVVNSAILGDSLVKASQAIAGPHLLVVDEVHRSGSTTFRGIFRAKFDQGLGLSATPKRATDTTFDEVISPALGGICYHYTFADAHRDEILPPFRVVNVALGLTQEERAVYDRFTDRIRKVTQRLRSRYYDTLRGKPEALFEAVLRRLQANSSSGDPDISSYFELTTERKRALYTVGAREKCLSYLLDPWLAEQKDLSHPESPRTLVFHESISSLVELQHATVVERKGLRPLFYTSLHPDWSNKLALELFRKGTVSMLLSVRALVEGLDVPEADVGIIVASSASPTQRIQSMGRVLRGKAEGKKGSLLVSFYVEGTTDERIFGRINWETIAPPERISYLRFRESPDAALLKIPAPERTPERGPLPSCSDIDESLLVVGGIYPGRWEGRRLGVDHRGELFVKGPRGRRYVHSEAVKELASRVRAVKPEGGAFLLNECDHALIKRVAAGRLETIYLGKFSLLKEMDES